MDTILEHAFPLSDVETLGTPTKEIKTKPYFSIAMSIVISIALLVTRSMALMILGGIFLALGIFAFVKLPDEKRLGFYEKCVIVYPPKYKDSVQKVDYDEVIEWVVRQGNAGGDNLILRLQGDIYIQCEIFNSVKVVRLFNNIMPEKEANRKRRDETKNTPLKWPWKKK